MTVDPGSRGWNEHRHRWDVPAGTIRTADLADGVVTTPKLAANAVTRVVLDQSLTADVWSNVALSAGDNAITGLINLAFTINEAADYLLMVLRASAQIGPPVTGAFGWDLFVDSAVSRRLPRVTIASGASQYVPGGDSYLTGLAAGAHTLSVEFWAQGAIASGAFLRAATAPTAEFLQVTLLEVRA